MKFEKTVIARMNMPYAISSAVVDGKPCVVCATEDHGPALIIAPPYREAETLVPGPGGCMSLLPDGKRPGQIFAVMGCFLGYKFQGGGIFRLRSGGPGGWTAQRIFDLPFAHRIELVDRGGVRYLIAANLAADKADPSDWSKPGGVFAARLGAGSEPVSGLEPILTGIHRNHGLLLSRFEGRSSLLVGGSEGLFAIDLEAPETQWPARQIMSTEVSEMAVFDIDGDGSDELVTIEPFHGNVLRAYKRTDGGWKARWDSELEFGHCILAGHVGGVPGIIASSRSGSRSLLLFQYGKTGESRPARIEVDPGAGAANMILLRHKGRDHIFATNQAEGEIAVYTPK